MGLKRGCAAKEIKKAYHNLALKHHPDKGGNPVLFQKLSVAYCVLADKCSRLTYDLFGTTC